MKMSVMIINDNTYNKVASTIETMIERNRVYCYPYNQQPLNELRKMIQHEVTQLRKQNYISYDKRYKDNIQVDSMEYYPTMPMTRIQLYKALQAILYQIETNYTSIFIDKFMKALANKIIMDLPEYETAQWG
jgi:hypothetical protein